MADLKGGAQRVRDALAAKGFACGPPIWKP